MSASQAEVQQGLRTLKQATEAILELDLESEGGIERLVQLQAMQEQLRKELEVPLTSSLKEDPSIRELIDSCLTLSNEVNRKLIIFRNFVSEQMNKLQEGEKSRSTYHQVFTQAEGYFIDYRK